MRKKLSLENNKSFKKITDFLDEKLVGAFYPEACPLCGRLIKEEENYLCNKCKTTLPYLKAPLCLKCGKEVENEEQDVCNDCGRLTRSYEKGFPVFNYCEPVSESLAGFKYGNKRAYAGYYAYEMVKCHGKSFCDIAPDALLPVPIHKSKLKKRGYNQAELIAKKLGKYLGVPVDSGVLARDINTLPQKNLNDAEREQNLKRAFIYTRKIVEYNKVILVDDIYTTGATVEACTRVLHDAGIKEVYYTSICIGKGY